MFNALHIALSNSWASIVIFLSIIIIVRLAYINSTSKRFILHEEVFLLLFVAYILILFELVTYKEAATGGLNLVPFTEIFRYKIDSSSFFIQVIGNILAFIPFGYFVASYAEVKKFGTIFIVGLLTSSVIEIVQYFIGRSFDIDDIILNILGCILGYLLYVGVSAITSRLPKIFRSNLFLNILSIAIVVLLVAYFLGFKIWSI